MPGYPPVPLSSYILGVFDVGRVDLISVNTLLQLEVFFDVNKSLIHTLLWPNLENAGIAFSRLSPDVLSGWLHSEFPWALEAGVFFKTVVGRPVISLHRFKVSTTVVFLQSGQSYGVFKVQVKLNVNRAFLPFLKLAVHVACLSSSEPLL